MGNRRLSLGKQLRHLPWENIMVGVRVKSVGGMTLGTVSHINYEEQRLTIVWDDKSFKPNVLVQKGECSCEVVE
ncbi:MAG: hypothetical protein WCO84_05005 [bacterium]